MRIGALAKRLVQDIPALSLDLIELSSWVYGIDAAISRGGPADQQMGAKWHRTFHVSVPVREPDRWRQTQTALEDLLFFLSGDRFRFTFELRDETAVPQYFQFGKDSGWTPDSVAMFSGGLDSLSGALEEIIERNNRVALVSHASATKILKVQKDLCKSMSERLGSDLMMHVPTEVTLRKGTGREGTHRTRSFLFAALGCAIGRMFGLNSINFFENGVVSLNLPPVGNVTGTKATRTTHPQTLSHFSAFFGTLFGDASSVSNPYFWRTKRDVVARISELGFADQIPHTRSCSDVRNIDTQHTHCGRCSQCIDRRFAMLAAGLEASDPSEAYKMDLFQGQRTEVRDREMALAYVRHALLFEQSPPSDLEIAFPELAAALSHLGAPAAARDRVADLLRRHAEGVLAVLRKETAKTPWHECPEHTLPRLFGDAQRMPLHVRSVESAQEPDKSEIQLVFAANGQSVNVGGVFDVSGATCDLLAALAAAWLRSAGQGIEKLDYETVSARSLAKTLGLDGEENLRKRISRSRSLLRGKFASAGRSGELGNDLIENVPGQATACGRILSLSFGRVLRRARETVFAEAVHEFHLATHRHGAI